MSNEFEPESELNPEPAAETDAEGKPELEAGADTEAETSTEPSPEPNPELSPEETDGGSEPASPPVKLERLQKILAQAGIASRRHAEELISEGRVQVNGQVVTTLGTKADAARDHIRVDGKLIHGAERLRYFMLNKPKGFVTTVSDPEGRPTVMQFFEKTRERVFPVGRLDYESEGLLLMTNDGALANQLTRAASGVEKTYLVKVSGQPAEEELDRLRGGVRIDRGKPGEGKVDTAPASIRLARQGDNPWYEVVLIEGRNRELRKMFQEIGHYVEKIRRVGYGPLVLDVEPGELRDLDLDEIAALRRAAEGKRKPAKTREPKPRETRPRDRADAAASRPQKPRRDNRESTKTFEKRSAPPFREREGGTRGGGTRAGWARAGGDRRSGRPAEGNRRSFAAKPAGAKPAWSNDREKPEKRSAPPFREREGGPRSGGTRAGRARAGGDRRSGRPAEGNRRSFAGKPTGARPTWSNDREKPEKRSAPPFREREGGPRAGGTRAGGARAGGDRRSGRPAQGNRRSFTGKPTGARPAWAKPAPRDESRPPSRFDRPEREQNRERPSRDSRRRFEDQDSPRGGGFDRRPAPDRPRNTERPQSGAREGAKRSFSPRKPGEGFRGKPSGPGSQQRPSRPPSAVRRSSERPPRAASNSGDRKNRRPFPPRPR